MPEQQTSGGSRRRADDDHDLLTYGEAGVRLREEIDSERARIATLPDGSALDAARRRLELLEEAAERNFRGRITDDNFERFFGYRGQATRNT